MRGRIERSAAARADLISHFVDLAQEASEATGIDSWTAQRSALASWLVSPRSVQP